MMRNHDDVKVLPRKRNIARVVAVATVLLLAGGVSACSSGSNSAASSSDLASDSSPPAPSHKSLVIKECFSELSAWLVTLPPEQIGDAQQVYGYRSRESQALYDAAVKFSSAEGEGAGRNEASQAAFSVLESACKKIGSKFHSEGLPPGYDSGSSGSEQIWSP